MLVFLFIDIVYTEEGTCKGCNFAEANEEGLMDLALWLYEDAAEEEDKAAKGESSGSYQLQIEFHKGRVFLLNRLQICPQK